VRWHIICQDKRGLTRWPLLCEGGVWLNILHARSNVMCRSRFPKRRCQSRCARRRTMRIRQRMALGRKLRQRKQCKDKLWLSRPCQVINSTRPALSSCTVQSGDAGHARHQPTVGDTLQRAVAQRQECCTNSPSPDGTAIAKARFIHHHAVAVILLLTELEVSCCVCKEIQRLHGSRAFNPNNRRRAAFSVDIVVQYTLYSNYI